MYYVGCNNGANYGTSNVLLNMHLYIRFEIIHTIGERLSEPEEESSRELVCNLYTGTREQSLIPPLDCH